MQLHVYLVTTMLYNVWTIPILFPSLVHILSEKLLPARIAYLALTSVSLHTKL